MGMNRVDELMQQKEWSADDLDYIFTMDYVEYSEFSVKTQFGLSGFIRDVEQQCAKSHELP